MVHLGEIPKACRLLWSPCFSSEKNTKEAVLFYPAGPGNDQNLTEVQQKN